jgi:GT2 family glycosyltransferase
MTSAPTLSIVVPVYNAGPALIEQLDALVASIDDTMEVVIVDNRSTDGSRTIVESYADRDPRVRLVQAVDRQGEPHARNVGVANARSEFIAFCDADDVVDAGWADAMRNALATADYVTGPVELHRLNPAWLAEFRGQQMFATMPRTAGEIPFAHGCNFGVRRSAVGTVGGFDERVLIGCDVDFAIRAHRAGVALQWAPDAVVQYRHRPTTRQRWRQAYAFGRAGHHLRVLTGETDALMTRVRRQARRAGWLVVSGPKVVRRAHRASWLWTLALALGEIRGGSW